MALYELYDVTGDQGMLVAGLTIDESFRREADEAGRKDERLLTIEDAGALLAPEALVIAAKGLCAHQNQLADSDR